ncbi:MAG: ABC transporter permease [Tannerella sp.]|jgi:ABC-2 type transport system permease protein|nr:ABC transporter permease [Tannerella sp.]
MLRFLLEKEFKYFFRNPILPKLIFVFPVMVMLVLPWVFTLDIKDINIIIVDSDNSRFSERLIQKIDQSGYFHLAGVTHDIETGMTGIEYGKADMILEIPSNFEKDLTNTMTAPVQISINTVNGNKSALGGSFMSQILQNFSTDIVQLKGNAQVVSVAGPRLEIVTRNRYNPYLDYKVFMIPALMVILMIVLCGILPALNIVGEKERGTIEQINVTPIPKFMFILSKLIPFWMMGLIIITICMILAYLVYGLAPLGNILVIYLFAMLFILTMSGFGLVISNYSSTMQQALFVTFFFMMIFQLMSGLLTPIRSMPEWAQWITAFIPPRYFVQAIRLLYLKGSTLGDLLPELFALLGFVVFLSGWAVFSYRKKA